MVLDLCKGKRRPTIYSVETIIRVDWVVGRFSLRGPMSWRDCWNLEVGLTVGPGQHSVFELFLAVIDPPVCKGAGASLHMCHLVGFL